MDLLVLVLLVATRHKAPREVLLIIWLVCRRLLLAFSRVPKSQLRLGRGSRREDKCRIKRIDNIARRAKHVLL